MILLLTNRPEYRNDIAEEIRLFYGQTDVSVAAEDGETAELTITAEIEPEHADGMIRAFASANGEKRCETMPMEGEDALSLKRVEKRAVKISVCCSNCILRQHRGDRLQAFGRQNYIVN